MKNVFFIIVLFSAYSFVLAQNPTFQWATSYSGNGIGIGKKVTVDNIGNVYTVGSFQGFCDFDPSVGILQLSSTSYTEFDVFVTKKDASGNLIWARKMGGNSSDFPSSIDVDNFGNIYTTGSIGGSADFDPGPNIYNLSGPGNFISKLDANGNFVWAKKIGGAMDIAITSVIADDSSNIYVGGYFSGSVNFNPDASPFVLTASSGAGFALKLAPSGNFVWAKKFASGAYCGRSMTRDNVGNLYFTGGFSGSGVDFDPGPGNTLLTSVQTEDAYILKLNKNGEFVWVRQLGGLKNQIGLWLGVDDQQNVYSIGAFETVVDTDPGSGTFIFTATSDDVYFSKLNAGGNFVWARHLESPGNAVVHPKDFTVDPLGNVYTTGSFSSTIDFDPSPAVYNQTATGGQFMFTQKLDFDGNFSWVTTINGSGSLQSEGVCVSNSSDVFVTGSFSNSADFNFGQGVFTLNAINNNELDPFVLKMGQCIDINNYIINACDSFVLGNEIYTNSGIYVKSLHSQTTGCDSIVRINLSLGHRNSSSITASVCSTYVLNGQSYFSSGNYSQHFTNISGCDSIVNLVLTIKNTYNTVTDTVCGSYTFNGTTYSQSGTYTQSSPNSAGCFLENTLDLIVLPNKTTTIVETVCDSYTLNSQTYTSSGIFNQVFTNSIGCDSIVSLHLTVNNNQSVINETACGSFSFNGQTYDSSGSFIIVLTNVAGCDSSITLNLTIYDDSVSVTQNGTTLSANISGAIYQWIDCNNGLSINGQTGQNYTATINGNYAVTISNGTCRDTSSCYSISDVGIEKTSSLFVSVFPNPTKYQAFVRFNTSVNNASIRLSDVSGKIVYEKFAVSGDVFLLDLSPYPMGIYYVEIKENNAFFRNKIIKN